MKQKLINLKKKFVYRSSITGRFVRALFAKLNPRTTVREEDK